MRFLVSPVHCLQDSQVLYSAKKNLKPGPTVLFTHLKIILLQCFQFLIFNNKRYPNRPLMREGTIFHGSHDLYDCSSEALSHSS